jgi:hypothetical protein
MKIDYIKNNIDATCQECDFTLNKFIENRKKKNAITGGGAIWGTDNINKLNQLLLDVSETYSQSYNNQYTIERIESTNDYLVNQVCERLLNYILDLKEVEKLYNIQSALYLFDIQGPVLKLRQFQLSANTSKYLDLFHSQIKNELSQKGVQIVNSVEEFNKINSAKPKSACYIATMAYGDHDHPQVLELRKFRDEVLLNSKLGIFFVRFYYKISPSMVEIFKNYKGVNSAIRGILNLIINIIKK